jgi:hypothetical protein
MGGGIRFESIVALNIKAALTTVLIAHERFQAVYILKIIVGFFE